MPDLRKMIGGGASPRLLRLPAHGRLLLCTDLHGNLRDFQRMRSLFEQAYDAGQQPFLLFTGDLIHGPSCEPEEWPSYLGTYFRDESDLIVEEFMALERHYPRQVASLLGNHEHSHVGGPHTPKFWPDETLHFEQSVGARLARRYRKLFKGFATVAYGSCGVVVTHAAPNAVIEGPASIEAIRYDGFEELPIATLEEMPLLGRLLWSRTCPTDTARRFLSALAGTELQLGMVIFGHEITADGYERIGDEQLLLSTSFGIPDSHKHYLSVDLGGRYRSTRDLRVGHELLRLYP